MISLELEIEYPDEGFAAAVKAAVEPENGGYAEMELRGTSLLIRSSSDSAGTLRNTFDDILACIKAAESSIGTVQNTA